MDINNQYKIRKQVYELTLSDINKYPIWEHALDEEGEEGQDEATVKPRIDLTEITDPDEGIFVVKAELIANDGTKYEGYCYVTDINDLGYIQPRILTDTKTQVVFWHGCIKPSIDEIQNAYKLLGKDSSALFPIEYRSLVKVKGVELEGIIPGFCYCDENSNIQKVL